LTINSILKVGHPGLLLLCAHSNAAKGKTNKPPPLSYTKAGDKYASKMNLNRNVISNEWTN